MCASQGVHCVDLGESFPTHIFLQIWLRCSRYRALLRSHIRNKCDFRAVQRSALCRSRRELSNSYVLFTYVTTCIVLAKFGFDTAENEPCKICRWRGPYEDQLAARHLPERAKKGARGGPPSDGDCRSRFCRPLAISQLPSLGWK